VVVPLTIFQVLTTRIKLLHYWWWPCCDDSWL